MLLKLVINVLNSENPALWHISCYKHAVSHSEVLLASVYGAYD